MGAFFSPVDISLLSTRSPSSYLFCFLFYLFIFFSFAFSFLLEKWSQGSTAQWDNVGPGQAARAARAVGGTKWMAGRMFWRSTNNGPELCVFASVLMVRLPKVSARAATFSSYCLTCPNCSIKWNTDDYRGLMSFLFMLLQRIKEGASCCCDQKELPGAAPQRLDSARLC